MIFGDVQQLTSLLQATPHGLPLDATFSGLSTDTRQLTPGSVFIALRGDQWDGHTFIPQALEQGACWVISQIPVQGPHLQVPDTLHAYQQISRWWREHFAIPVIGITGSAGKTTTKEFLASALSLYGCVLKSQANHNNDIGVAQTLSQLNSTHQFAVLEMAMRGSGEIARLAQTAQPTHALITNVGTAHIGRLGSREAIATAKCELLTVPSLQIAILNGEDDRLVSTASRVWTGATLTYGLTAGHFQGLWDPYHQTIQIGSLTLPIPLPGRHHALNWMSVLATLHSLGLDLERLQSGVQLEASLQGRNQIKMLPGSVQVLDETYNAAPEAIAAALQSLCQTEQGIHPNEEVGRYWAILGPMRELGDFAPQLYAEIGSVAAQLPLFQVLLFDPDHQMQPLADQLAPDQVKWFREGNDLVSYLLSKVQPKDRLLFKAARAIALESVMQPFVDQWSSTRSTLEV